jgi:hypothetical protein
MSSAQTLQSLQFEFSARRPGALVSLGNPGYCTGEMIERMEGVSVDVLPDRSR